MFSVKPLYLPDIIIAAEYGVLQHSVAFHIDVNNSDTFEVHLI